MAKQYLSSHPTAKPNERPLQGQWQVLEVCQLLSLCAQGLPGYACHIAVQTCMSSAVACAGHQWHATALSAVNGLQGLANGHLSHLITGQLSHVLLCITWHHVHIVRAALLASASTADGSFAVILHNLMETSNDAGL